MREKPNAYISVEKSEEEMQLARPRRRIIMNPKERVWVGTELICLRAGSSNALLGMWY
jgi:hypothetical protein